MIVFLELMMDYIVHIAIKHLSLKEMIKILHIKHWVEPRSYIDDDMRYTCNRACSITPEKIAKKRKDVTCKNCLKRMDKKRW
jgi:hypothetical protein